MSITAAYLFAQLFDSEYATATRPGGVRWHNSAMRDGGGSVGYLEYQDELAQGDRVDRVMRDSVRVATLGRGDQTTAPEVPACHAAG